MNKTYFHTYDIFNLKDELKNLRWFKFCHNEALNSGLIVTDIIDESTTKLELKGTRSQFLKYYLRTLMKCEDKIKGIVRLISFLTLH